MFYCEECRKRNEWPESFGGSHGICEICGKVRDCHDVASKFLPLPKDRFQGMPFPEDLEK